RSGWGFFVLFIYEPSANKRLHADRLQHSVAKELSLQLLGSLGIRAVLIENTLDKWTKTSDVLENRVLLDEVETISRICRSSFFGTIGRSGPQNRHPVGVGKRQGTQHHRVY